MAFVKDTNILKFSQNEELYEMFVDYFTHYRANHGEEGLDYQTHDGEGRVISFSDKEGAVHEAMMKEILSKAGIPSFDGFSYETWASHPTLRWASFAVVNTLIDAVLPNVLMSSIGTFAEIRNVGWGDSASFEIEPRDLFVVSKSGSMMKQGELTKQYRGQVNVLAENHTLSVSSSLYRVLAGQESLAKFAAKAVMSMEASVARDAYSAFATAMNALDNSGDDALRISGWTDSTAVHLAQTVGAWNGGAEPMFVGTKLALGDVLPTSNVNYRYSLGDGYVTIGYLKEFKGYGVMELPQIAKWETEFDLVIDDTKVWLLSPTVGKPVKVVLEGSTLGNTTDQFGNANLTQQTNLHKRWGTGIATSALAGTIELS